MPVKIRVRNFQSLKDARLTVDGLTVVTGGNNCGKTALVRALKGAVQNTRGSAFVRHGAKKCTVELDFGDRKLKWEKGPKHPPTYTIDDGEPIRPGQGVPPEVEALGVSPIIVNKQKVWPQIADQFTGQVFLLDQPGSMVAEAVADVSRVGSLNKALRSSESDKRSNAATLKVRRSDLTLAEAELQGFEGLDDVVALVVAVEAERERAEKIAKAIEGVTELQGRYERSAGIVEALAGIEDVPDPPDPAEAEKLLGELRDLEQLRKRYQSAQSEVENLAGVEDVPEPPDAAGAEKLERALGMLTGLRERMQQAREGIVLWEADLADTEKELAAAEAEAIEVLGTFSECPTCGGVVHEGGCS
jgi:exonuclease SbcC